MALTTRSDIQVAVAQDAQLSFVVCCAHGNDQGWRRVTVCLPFTGMGHQLAHRAAGTAAFDALLGRFEQRRQELQEMLRSNTLSAKERESGDRKLEWMSDVPSCTWLLMKLRSLFASRPAI